MAALAIETSLKSRDNCTMMCCKASIPSMHAVTLYPTGSSRFSTTIWLTCQAKVLCQNNRMHCQHKTPAAGWCGGELEDGKEEKGWQG
eukprot:2171259-Rhodomonas_salina.2